MMNIKKIQMWLSQHCNDEKIKEKLDEILRNAYASDAQKHKDIIRVLEDEDLKARLFQLYEYDLVESPNLPDKKFNLREALGEFQTWCRWNVKEHFNFDVLFCNIDSIYYHYKEETYDLDECNYEQLITLKLLIPFFIEKYKEHVKNENHLKDKLSDMVFRSA